MTGYSWEITHGRLGEIHTYSGTLLIRTSEMRIPVLTDVPPMNGLLCLRRLHYLTPEILVSRGQTFRGRGTSGHYCQHSVIQWNFIRVTSRRSVTSKKCNCAMRAMRNWSFISAGLTSITRDCGVSLPRSMSNTRGSTA